MQERTSEGSIEVRGPRGVIRLREPRSGDADGLPLPDQVDRGEAAAQMGLAELSGKAILPASIEATHPVLTLSVLAGPA